MAASRFFPWRLFLRLMGAQAVALIAVSAIVGIPIRDIAILLVVLTAFSALVAKPYFQPLGRLIEKAKNLDQSPSETELVGRREYEWEELELALDRMRSDLKSKSDALARERQELEVLMAAIPEAIVAVDTETRLLFFNSRFALLFGEPSRETRPVLGEVFRSPEVLESFRRTLNPSHAGAESVSVQLRTRTDQFRDFELSVTSLRRDNGITYAAVGIFHDVTESKRAEKIRIDFVANVSHELRTPLTAIKGFTDTLSEDIRAQRFDSIGRYVDVIQRNTERLMTLIEDLLDLSSLESGESGEFGEAGGESFAVNRTTVPVREITSRVIAQLEPKRMQKNLAIEAAYGVESVQSDPRRLEQVLVNLIDNAIKYGKEGGWVRVVWEKAPSSVLLRVRDNGPGIPPKYLPRLFERFFRVDKARSREMGGTGLGLAIVKHIVQRHGGTVQVQSEIGQGTEFVCEFPES